MVERLTLNQDVAGSSPALPTINYYWIVGKLVTPLGFGPSSES